MGWGPPDCVCSESSITSRWISSRGEISWYAFCLQVGPPWVISVWVSLRSCLCSLPKRTPRVVLGRVVPLVDLLMIRALFMSGICSVRG